MHSRGGLWGNLAAVAFCLGLAVFARWLDHRSHGEVSVFVWGLAGVFVLVCDIPVNAIRRPQSRLLAIEGRYLLWRISNRKTGQVALEHRLALDSIRALKWVVPMPADCSRGQDYGSARLLFITAERSTHTLPEQFFPAAYRRKIEAALKQELPALEIVEKLESPN